VRKHSLLPLACFFAASAWAQPFSAGVKVGLPLTDFIHTVSGQSSSVTNRYLVGPTAELHLPFHLGIEVDALYRHFNYQNVFGSGINAVTSLNTSGAWEFPVLLKYRFPEKVAKPYVDAGVAWDKISGFTNTLSTSISTGTIANPSGQTNSTTTGFVMGAGVDVHFIVHIMPELRYTRWTDQHFNLSNILNSNRNQAEFMVGITF
jgi:opacity protein-like surface antigen